MSFRAGTTHKYAASMMKSCTTTTTGAAEDEIRTKIQVNNLELKFIRWEQQSNHCDLFSFPPINTELHRLANSNKNSSSLKSMTYSYTV